MAGECTLEAPCRTDLAAATPQAVQLSCMLRESDVRSGEVVPVTTWGPTLAAARTPILPDSLREGGKGSFSPDCCCGQGAQGRSSSAACKWSVYHCSREGTAESCPHLTGMLRRAFTPVGSRKCGGVSQSDVGRKTTTATPVNLPLGA